MYSVAITTRTAHNEYTDTRIYTDMDGSHPRQQLWCHEEPHWSLITQDSLVSWLAPCQQSL